MPLHTTADGTAALPPRPLAHVGLIGFGAIGRAVAELLLDGAGGPAELVAVLVRDPARHAADADRFRVPFLAEASGLVRLRPDLVLEAGGHEALRCHVPAVLRAGIDVAALSVGALADPATMREVQRAAEVGHARLRVPSGAIAGLDAISAAAVGRVTAVRHTVRKPPASLLPAGEAAAVTASAAPRELYRGPAREAAARFPANVNVVAAVSLAGIGLDRTEVVIVADPGVTRNTHEVTVEGAFGRLHLRMENVPGPNPKTGVVVPLSLVRVVRSLSERVVVGA